LDVQASIGLPFFISVPLMNGNGRPRALKHAKKTALLPGKTGEAGEAAAANPQAAPQTNGPIALWEKNQGLQPFYETLRDRLMTYFEMINLTHKPKLVAVTSCAPGAGVTSTAAGLASSLSETGDGNVLLVNMNVRDGEAHHFYKGKLACGLDEVLEKGTREGAHVGDNLYVAREQENNENLPRVLPRRFSHLVPKMKASDFDYIIFDMPPVSQISITPRLARFMDMVLLVVESEKTDRDVAKRVAAMLSETKTNVGIVLNKNRSYLPRRLHQEI
jgi:Mrp family chromosome partitioning ATPase